ncbi:MAG: hypothetical protein P1V81_12935 [Planctomycetota bacterium]|nr:hypothetical protein [Planctomycetota bacterium]
MYASLVNLGLAGLGIYAVLGLAFAVAFAVRGAQAIDPAAEQGTWGFRVLIVPGAAALWPLLLLRWVRGDGEPPEERGAHRDGARGGGA